MPLSGLIRTVSLASEVAYFDDFEFTQTARGVHLRHITLLFADQSARDRRRKRQQSLLDVSLVLTDDLVLDLLVFIDIEQRHRSAENHFTASVQTRDINDLGIGQFAFDIANPRFDESLLFTGRVVFGVFLQITVRPRL